ncbi:hypothetical protein GCM10027162_72850 [Streptomyces incanus]
MTEVIAAMDGTLPQRCFQSSSARAMGSNERLSGFGTQQTLPAGHMPVSPVSPFDQGLDATPPLSVRSKRRTLPLAAFEHSLKHTGGRGST